MDSLLGGDGNIVTVFLPHKVVSITSQDTSVLPRILTSQVSDIDLTARDAKMFGSPKERLDFYRREIRYETSILSNRTNAYLTAQSFLVIAFSSCMANLNPEWGKLFTLVVPPFLALLGVLSSLNAWPGIRAAYEIIDHWYYKQSELLRSEPVMGLAYDESPLFCERESTHKGYRKALLFFSAHSLDFCDFLGSACRLGNRYSNL